MTHPSYRHNLFQHVANSRRTLMEQISVFKSNKSQAVRPPKPVALCESGTQAGVITQGNARLIVPGDKNRDSWFDAEDVSNGFMSVRDQPPYQERNALQTCSSTYSTPSSRTAPRWSACASLATGGLHFAI